VHYLLFYDVAPNYLERRALVRAEHLALARAAVQRGELILGGALADPVDGAVLLFRGDSPAVAEAFAAADPYVRQGLVTRWRVRAWTTVVGEGAAMPVGLSPFLQRPTGFGKPVCRLGLAFREGSSITPEDVCYAIARGINFLNWPGEADLPGGPDAVSQTVAALGSARESVVVCVQFGARTATEAAAELRAVLATLKTDYVDLLTLYYVEQQEEWRQLLTPGGAMEFLQQAKRDRVARQIGVTSHQRRLAAEMAGSGLLDALMVRYNAAHRGAETEVFPVADGRGLPVIAYTALRWGALLESTPDDPPGFTVPRARAWYRFVLQAPSVTVVLAAPDSRAELEEDLSVLYATGPLSPVEYEQLAAHGLRVRKHAGRFP